MSDKKSIYDLQMELQRLENELAELKAPKVRPLGAPRVIPMKFSTLYNGIVIPVAVSGERLQRVISFYGWPKH